MPGLSSTALLQADMVTVSGSAVTIGPTGVPTQPVAQALPLVEILGDIAAALTSIQEAFLTIARLRNDRRCARRGGLRVECLDRDRRDRLGARHDLPPAPQSAEAMPCKAPTTRR